MIIKRPWQLALCWMLAFPSMVWAEVDTLSKVKASNRFVIGTRDSSAPLAYSLGNGKYTGYHVEVCQAIAEAVKHELHLPRLAVDYILVNSQNRQALVINGTVDIECGSTTNSRARQREVAFAPTTYIANVRMAVKADSGIQGVKDLSGKTVVTTAGTTSVLLLRKQGRATGIEFKQLLGKDHAESFLLVESGRADGFVMDNNILAGLIANAKVPTDFKLVGETLSEEPIALMLRRDDPAFQKLVDDSVRRLMKSGELARLYAKWFLSPIPPRGVTVDIPMTASLRNAIQHPNSQPAESYRK